MLTPRERPSGESARPDPPLKAVNEASPSTFKGTLTDGRERGDWASRYSFWAWVQIAIEGVYLVGFLAVALCSAFEFARAVSASPPADFMRSLLALLRRNQQEALAARLAAYVKP